MQGGVGEVICEQDKRGTEGLSVLRHVMQPPRGPSPSGLSFISLSQPWSEEEDTIFFATFDATYP